ncbi:MAG TPA: MBL fold metallo-hydrolase [Mycobacteriales bacterium]|nr:MBL fold metallo-hydrolase [Mycobacteriales bacterium]
MMSHVRAGLEFLGGAGTVTGSKFLVTTDNTRVLVDCGLFQGLRELRRRNWDPFPLPAGTIDSLVVSHAHLDHTGYLPALVREGFRGPVYATAATAALAEIVLRDSAHLLAEDAEHARTHGYSKHDPPLPLYTDDDVRAAIELFQPVEFGATVDVGTGITLQLQPAGHILGSSSVMIAVDGGPRILFSGDLGRNQHPLLRPPPPPPDADAIVVESTYGNRQHERDDDHGRLADAIRRTVARGGSVVIPAFAVDRTEVILMGLRELRRAGAIPDIPIYVDSPMALAALQVYRSAIRRHDPELRGDLPSADTFDPGNVHELRTAAESKTINNPRWPCLIISASGMATGGRVLHHLEALLPESHNTVVLAGYQAVGTRGRDLLEGARSLKLHGRDVAVRAEIVNVPFFSVHADATEILDWLRRAPRPPARCFVVHGEPEAAEAMAGRIQNELGWSVTVPFLGQRVGDLN